MTFGIDSTGFTIKRLSDIESEIDQDIAAQWGSSVQTDYSTIIGQLKHINALREANLWEMLYSLYTAFSIRAEGLLLDSIVQFANMQRIPAIKSTVDVLFTGIAWTTTIPANTVVQSTITKATFKTPSVPIDITEEGTVLVTCTAIDYGAISAPAHSITVLPVQISGIISIDNQYDAVKGHNRETDDALRIRFIQSRSGIGYCRYNAVINRILTEVPGVAACTIIDRSDGFPEVVADCSSSVYQALAEKIWEVKPLGICTSGDLYRTVTDTGGVDHRIRFSVITDIYAWVAITLVYSSEIPFPNNGVLLVKNAIVNYGNNLGIGNDFILQSLYVPIYSIPGIVEAIVQIGVTSIPSGETVNFVTTNIAVSNKNRIKFDAARIMIS
jgi:uncharacterized phage protein gp47/JayE